LREAAAKKVRSFFKRVIEFESSAAQFSATVGVALVYQGSKCWKTKILQTLLLS
jgi:hypothetical protein